MSDLVERLLKRAKDDQACADNSKVIVDALSEQMRLFESREGHNVYAVRMAVDHKSGMDRDNRYASDLREAASRISQQDAELERLRREVEATQKYAGEKSNQVAALIRELNEARKAAFIEAAEIATATGTDAENDWPGETWIAGQIAAALRRKAEETRT